MTLYIFSAFLFSCPFLSSTPGSPLALQALSVLLLLRALTLLFSVVLPMAFKDDEGNKK